MRTKHEFHRNKSVIIKYIMYFVPTKFATLLKFGNDTGDMALSFMLLDIVRYFDEAYLHCVLRRHDH